MVVVEEELKALKLKRKEEQADAMVVYKSHETQLNNSDAGVVARKNQLAHDEERIKELESSLEIF